MLSRRPAPRACSASGEGEVLGHRHEGQAAFKVANGEGGKHDDRSDLHLTGFHYFKALA